MLKKGDKLEVVNAVVFPIQLSLKKFNLLMTTLRVETFKMNHSLQEIVLINAPESDRIVTSSLKKCRLHKQYA